MESNFTSSSIPFSNTSKEAEGRPRDAGSFRFNLLKIYRMRYLVLLIGAFILASCNEPENQTTSAQSEANKPEINEVERASLPVVAVLNSDSVMENYKLAVKFRDKLNTERIRYDNILRNKQEKLLADADQLQKDAPTLSQFEGQVRQRKLLEEEQKLQMLQEQYAGQLMDMESSYTKQLNEKVSGFLKEYCSDKSYDMVISDGEMGLLRWYRDELDITREVVDELNLRYDQEQNKPEETNAGS
ncbi:MAG TPA: hypothetical protein DDX92_09200 [Flavobacteriales bacterium]|nr:hypothetical protein [Flavobacteriales bacterium]